MKNKVQILALSSVITLGITNSSNALTSGELLQRATNVVIGTSSAYLIPISPQQETQLGEQIKTQVFTQYKEYNTNKNLVNYVRAIGAKVAAIASRKNEIKYQFYILNSPEVNAFTIPGGSVFITTECLKYIKNEAELSGVLAHEIGHNERKHTIASLRRAMAARGVAGAFSQDDPALVKALASITLNLVLNGYSRKQEKEADETGTLLITRLGYEPKSLTGFLQTLLKMYGKNPSQFAQLFQTHPGPKERINNLNKFIYKNNLTIKKPITNESIYKKYESVLPAKATLKQPSY